MMNNPTPETDTTTTAVTRERKPKASHRRKAQPSKKEIGIRLLKRPKGASIAELQKAMGWQAHSVRGFLAGTIKKLPGLTLCSEKPENGPRRYRAVSAEESTS